MQCIYNSRAALILFLIVYSYYRTQGRHLGAQWTGSAVASPQKVVQHQRRCLDELRPLQGISRPAQVVVQSRPLFKLGRIVCPATVDKGNHRNAQMAHRSGHWCSHLQQDEQRRTPSQEFHAGLHPAGSTTLPAHLFYSAGNFLNQPRRLCQQGGF